MEDIFQRELGMKKFSLRWARHFPSSAQKVARVEASKEMSRILQESEANQLEGITRESESWFRYSYSSSKMFARSQAQVIPRT
jgi:hypothetical protein